MYKIGDRVYWRTYGTGCIHTGIDSAIVTGVEERHGVIDIYGTEADYFMYDTNKGVVESYNCLSPEDPDVEEYIGWQGGLGTLDVKEEIAQLLYKKGYIDEPTDVCAKGFFINLYNIDEVDPVYGETADY